ncbi:MAG TPA: hypothetical protein VFV85_03575, partial [Conexibacter sp.]|nr:hypothetical protein [Conexibacter sp.]
MPADSPDTAAPTPTALVPAPGAEAHGALEPYDVLVPYSKRHVVLAPFGFVEPARVADVCVTADAAPVEA